MSLVHLRSHHRQKELSIAHFTPQSSDGFGVLGGFRDW